MTDLQIKRAIRPTGTACVYRVCDTLDSCRTVPLHQMSKTWKQEITRCRGRKPDGKRCKVDDVEAGSKFCEHHDTDLDALFRDSERCIDIMSGRYPKRHHPACDRKGINDCECHTYTRGAQIMRTIQKAVNDSASALPLYRNKRKLEMRIKVKKIRNYYNDKTEAELWLPYKPGFRQFRFFVWDDKQERVVVRVIKDNMKNKATLLKWLRKLAPLHVYYTTSAWLNPQGVGPNPHGKRGRNKFRKKGWSYKMKNYHNVFLWQELYFDVDYCNADYNAGAKTLGNLMDSLSGSAASIGYSRNPTLVFSGGKGFHLVDTEWRIDNVMHDEQIKQYHNSDLNEKQEVNREFKEKVISNIRKEGILIDYDVTPDPRRIIRLPETVHGKTLRVCKIITTDDLTWSENKVIGYTPDSPIG